MMHATTNAMGSTTQYNFLRFFNASNNALKSINFSFHCGDRVRIVGKNGSGKSTLAKLLSCLIKPTHGTIKINGVPMQSYDRTFLKQKIVYVNQDEPFLNESILDYFNALGIAFSKDSLKEKLDLWNFHQDLTENSTEIQLTDNAKKLSGGMRKKLLAIKLFEKIIGASSELISFNFLGESRSITEIKEFLKVI